MSKVDTIEVARLFASMYVTEIEMDGEPKKSWAEQEAIAWSCQVVFESLARLGYVMYTKDDYTPTQRKMAERKARLGY